MMIPLDLNIHVLEWKIILFLVISVAIVWISRHSLRLPGSHGFYRFFTFEAITGLLVLNLDQWFRDPFSWHQSVSWPLLLISLFLVFHAFHLLRTLGKPDERREQRELLGPEKTTRLVKAGAYQFIRHPMYSSLLFLAWGVFFKRPSWAGVALALAATVSLFLTARMEEAENLRFFGAAYGEYMNQTRMFIPYLF